MSTGIFPEYLSGHAGAVKQVHHPVGARYAEPVDIYIVMRLHYLPDEKLGINGWLWKVTHASDRGWLRHR